MEYGRHLNDVDLLLEPSADTIERWRSLWSSAERPTPNASPERFLAITRALGAQPAIIEVIDGSGRQGMIIARRQRMRVSGRIGYLKVRSPELKALVVVYGGILGSASPDAYVEGLVTKFTGNGNCDLIALNGLETNSPLLSEITLCPNAVIKPPVPHWVQRLEGSFVNVLKVHSGKHRRRLASERRKLEAQFTVSPEWITLTEKDDVEKALTDAASIDSRTYHRGIGTHVERNEVWRSQVQPPADLGALRAHFLIGDGTPIAFLLGWNYQDSLHVAAMGYLPAYAKYSPGKHLLLHAIERACEDGMKWVDYGFGDADYKRIYGTHSWEESTINIYGPSVYARAVGVADRNIARLNKWLKKRAGTAPASRVKKLWRTWMGRK